MLLWSIAVPVREFAKNFLYPRTGGIQKNHYLGAMNDLPQQILKGSLSTIILKLLSENEAMYGYEICQRVKEITAGQMRVTEGALYPALHKLEGEGILRTHTQVVEGRTRKYYAIVPDQHGQAVSRLAQMQVFLEQLQQVLNPGANVTLT